MTLTQLLVQYGYLAVFVGALLEGETVLVLAGFAAHQGYLSFFWVVAFALCGGTLGDQTFFLLGRRYGTALLERFPGWKPGAQRASRLLQRFHTALIIGVRFLYGLRVVGPMAIGMSGVPVWRFAVLNLIGAALWALLVAGAGFLFGHALQWLFADIKRYEEGALLLIAALVVAFGLWRRLRQRWR
ncbi:DedA family protein [Pseudogulbenkiania sp. NH8B]|uniref:DedA family protein n=1 Tax=Pseudogulbenkiania sp. (strain NH8B) TaxID=748280 RepID=UPI000227A131|nr:DedA family protein [Pseudogulbenkiania sp. NH8B]BAK78522.1 DedA family protein [Pseudogulbenkiania sp. NH8B]